MELLNTALSLFENILVHNGLEDSQENLILISTSNKSAQPHIEAHKAGGLD